MIPKIVRTEKGERFVRLSKPHLYKESGQWLVSGVGFVSNMVTGYRDMKLKSQNWAIEKNTRGTVC